MTVSKRMELSVTGDERNLRGSWPPYQSDPKLTRSTLPRRPRETLKDFNELVVRSATGIAKFIDLMFVREPVQAR